MSLILKKIFHHIPECSNITRLPEELQTTGFPTENSKGDVSGTQNILTASHSHQELSETKSEALSRREKNTSIGTQDIMSTKGLYRYEEFKIENQCLSIRHKNKIT